ncbi:dimethylarginine dimethylaminohydrolase family protein [Thalassobacillus sp. CUG 92003]|uniref:dimethylarginine dimethylaminohydrolase family protein n=1 Tax=Thalassobacillus sp. CUG 92003 TaxID=2736641 RepID=UPI0015E6CA4E|nr:arginine deiminase family protein [Thalassobacillus sp. CUG 92003]
MGAVPQRPTKNEIGCRNEYGTLQKAIVCAPRFMRIEKTINETQKHYANENINREKAMKQHETFIQTLEDHHVDVIHLAPSSTFNEQVFTRDIGFCIGKQIVVGAMKSDVRWGEEKVLRQYLEAHDIPYQQLPAASIEGGDIMIDHDQIWVGISDRTPREAVRHLKHVFPEYNIQRLKLNQNILHLDCAFNIISKHVALIYREAFDSKEVERLASHYELVDITDEEQFFLGANVLSIDGERVISLPQNNRINALLSRMGFDVIEVEFSEIIKSGGSFRCCTLPICRN